MAHTIESSRKMSLVKIGGALGIAACFIALAIFLMALCGFYAAFMLAPLAVLLGGVGIVLGVLGGICHKSVGDEETQPLAALFVGFLAVVVGLLELQFWMNWPK